MTIRNLCIAGAVAAAFLSFSAPVTRAADMSTTTTTDTMSTTTTTTATPAMATDSMAKEKSAMSMDNIDYKTLIHPMWDYTDLQGAKAYGLTDTQVATVAKIAWKTGWTFTDVLSMVQRGESFGFIAQKANLPLSEVMDSTEIADKIAAYKMAYEHSGQKAMMMDSSSKM